jgi:hypothetical protein
MYSRYIRLVPDGLGIKSNNLVAKPYAIHMSLEVILRVLSGVETRREANYAGVTICA